MVVLFLMIVMAAMGVVYAISTYRTKLFIPGQIKKLKQLHAENKVEEALGIIYKLESGAAKEHPDVLWIKSQCEVKQGHYLMAIVTLNNALRLHEYPEDQDEASLRRELARIYELGGRTREALTEYYLLTEQNPDFFDGNFKIGKFHFNNKNWKDAEKFLKQAHISNRDDLESPLLLAKMYIEKGEGNLAEPFLNTILSKQAEHEEALYQMGLLQLSRTNMDSAMDYFKKTEVLNGPFFHLARVRRGMCENFKGNLPAAYELLATSVKELPVGKLLKEIALDVVNIIITLRKYSEVEEWIYYFKKAFPAEDLMSSKTDLMKHLSSNADLADFFGIDTPTIVNRMRLLLEEREYVCDDAVIQNENQILFKIHKKLKGTHKQNEVLFLILKPDHVSRTQMFELTSWMKQNQARSIIVATPFDFTSECLQYVKPMPVNLISGALLSRFLSGKTPHLVENT